MRRTYIIYQKDNLLFQKFWKTYPEYKGRNNNKNGCRHIWEHNVYVPETLSDHYKIIPHLLDQIKKDCFHRGIPYPITYLSRRMWEYTTVELLDYIFNNNKIWYSSLEDLDKITIIPKKQNYLEVLKNPLWQKKRLKIFERDNFTCQLCLCTETTLHVHHKTYIKGNLPWEYDDTNFITLCENCHSLISNNKKVIYA